MIAKGTDVCAVLTQPDRRVGRGRKVKPNSIKLWAWIMIFLMQAQKFQI